VALVFIANSAWGLTASYRNQDTPILGWPAGLSYVAFPIALVALTIHAVGRVIAAALGLPSSQNVFAEADVDSPELSEVTR
jgi:TRAP-type C4-dicarboxylate transport system permease small subunit